MDSNVKILSQSFNLVQINLKCGVLLTCSFINLIALFPGVGIGIVFNGLMMGYSRNPTLKQQLFSYAILGFALTEAMGLFCLMVAFMLLFAM